MARLYIVLPLLALTLNATRVSAQTESTQPPTLPAGARLRLGRGALALKEPLRGVALSVASAGADATILLWDLGAGHATSAPFTDADLSKIWTQLTKTGWSGRSRIAAPVDRSAGRRSGIPSGTVALASIDGSRS